MSIEIDRQEEQRKQQKLHSVLEAARRSFEVAAAYQVEVIAEATSETLNKAQNSLREALRSAAKVAKEIGREVRL